MTKITFKKEFKFFRVGEVLPLESSYIKNGYLYSISKPYEVMSRFPIKCLSKIEKQIKDLTLEECKKLDIEYHCYCITRKIRKNDVVESYLYWRYSEDDYIDITNMVKGEQNEE